MFHKAGSLHGAGEPDPQAAIRIHIFVAILGRTAGHARRLDGAEGPRRLPGCACVASPGLRALAHPGRKGRVPRQGFCRHKDHRLRGDGRLAALPAEGAFHPFALALKGETFPHRGVIHRLVKGHTDHRAGTHVRKAFRRLDPQHLGPQGAELPPIVRLQDTASGTGQSGGHAGRVFGGGQQALLRSKNIDRRVQPLPLAAHRWHKGQRIGQLVLALDGRQGHHRPVKDHRHPRVGVQFVAAGRGHHLAYPQDPHRVELKAGRFLHRRALGIARRFGHRHPVARAPLQPALGGKGHGPRIVPGERTLDSRRDRERGLYTRPVHRLVETQFHRPVEGLLLPPGRAVDQQSWCGQGQRCGSRGGSFRRQRSCRRCLLWRWLRGLLAAGAQRQREQDQQEQDSKMVSSGSASLVNFGHHSTVPQSRYDR